MVLKADILDELYFKVDRRGIEETVARDSPVYAVRLTDRLVAVVERLELNPAPKLT